MDTPVAPASDPAIIPVSTPAEADRTPISPSEAARQLSEYRWKRDNPEQETSAEAATPAQESEAAPAADDATPPLEATGETQDANPVEEPPLERPRSWSKERDDIWTKLDRAAQQYLLEHDSEVSKGIRKAQNDAAEARKAADADRAKADQARQQYEAAYPQLQQAIETYWNREYADIRSVEDEKKLAVDDPLRYLRYRADRDQAIAISSEIEMSKQRQAQEKQNKFSEFSTKADAELLSRMPELGTKEKQTEVANRVMKMVEDAGLPPQEFMNAWTGKGEIPIRHPAIQEMMAKAALYDIAKEKAAKPSAKPVPAVQKPGVSKAPQTGKEAEIQTLESRFDKSASRGNSSSIRDAAALLAARRARSA